MKNGFLGRGKAIMGLFVWLSGASVAQAQSALGQPSLDEAKVQIWCATMRFVYDDTGHPGLKNSLRCEAGNLDALAASIRPDSQRVYSLLYQPIEGRGAIYQGKKNDPARLAALTKAIISKLRSSAARRKDPARLARLEALATALNTYVTSGTPPGELTAASAAAAPAEASPAPAAAPGLAEAAETEAAGKHPAAPTATTDAAGSLMNRIFSPLALSLSLLSLVLFGLLRANVSRLLRRQQREVGAAAQAAQQAQQAADQATRATSDAAASAAAATATASQIAAGASAAAKAASELPLSLSKLSAGQRGEVEELIRQRVAAEVARLLPPVTAPSKAGFSMTPDEELGIGEPDRQAPQQGPIA